MDGDPIPGFDDLADEADHYAEPKPSLLMPLSEVLTFAKKPLPWIIKGHYLRDSLAQIFGPHKQYKTFVAIDLALSIASGEPFLNTFPVREQGLVIYVAGEGSRGVGHRIKAWLDDRGMTEDEVCLYQSKGAVPISTPGAAIALRDEIAELQAASGMEVIAIVVDTLARNFGDGDENKTPDMNRFISCCDRYLREPFKALVVLVHHVGHGDGSRGRGSVALPAACDTSVKVSGTFDAISYEPEFQKDGETPESLVLEGELIDVGTDNEGDPIRSIVLRTTDLTPAEARNDTTNTAILRRVLERYPNGATSDQARADFLDELSAEAIKKGVTPPQNGVSRKKWSRALSQAEKHADFFVKRDTTGNIKKLAMAQA